MKRPSLALLILPHKTPPLASESPVPLLPLGRTPAVIAMLAFALPLFADRPAAPTTLPATPPAFQPDHKPVKDVPSDDLLVGNFHSLGEINGRSDIYRSADPLRYVNKKTGKAVDDPATLAAARVIFQHLYDRGIRTIIDFERPPATGGDPEHNESEARLALEKKAAESVGITFVADPMANKGKKSFEDMTDAETLAWLQKVDADIFTAAKRGGVEYHCLGGRDRTGIITAYLRLKYQHWTADQAIQEMRDRGHVWTNFSRDGGKSSWHEDHLRAIAAGFPIRTTPTETPPASTPPTPASQYPPRY